MKKYVTTARRERRAELCVGRGLAALLLGLALVACGGGGGTPAAQVPPPPTNQAPVAHGGAAQSVLVGTRVLLDGRGSADADGDPLSYRWTLSTRPSGSTAELTAPTSATPSFTADVPGQYLATLVVDDGRASSAAASVAVAAALANAAPVAHAGATQIVATGTRVVLSAAASSDADGDPLSHRWTLSSRPPGSMASLSDAETASPAFVADVAGSYTASLVVHDGRQSSAPAMVTVNAASAALSASVTPALADFGSVPVGSSGARVFTVRNTGTGSLSFKAGHPVTDGGVWALGGRSCVGTLAAGASCTVTVSFVPANAQAYTGSVEFAFNELASGQGAPRASLTGTGVGGVSLSASASPALADFGSVPIGMSASRVFTLRNNGSGPLSFKPGYPMTDGAPWSLGARSCLGTLAAGASCSVTVNFDPVNAQAYSGSVYFYFNELQVGQGNPMASLSGVGTGDVAMSATITPLAADFGNVPVGMVAERVFTIANTGNRPLTLRPGSPGTSGGVWSMRGGSCAAVLPVGASCTTTVAFTPVHAQAQTYSGSLDVHFIELPLGQGSLRAALTGQSAP